MNLILPKVVSLLALLTLLILILNKKSTFYNINNSTVNIYSRFNNKFLSLKGKKSLNGIDMVYAITMPQRKEYISQQINKLDISCTYFDAITPKDLTESDYRTLSSTYNPNSRTYHKFTRFPVLLSFLMCFMDSLVKGYKTIIVFEDDMRINVDINLLNESLGEFNKSECDVFYMGYCFLTCKQRVTKYKHLIELTNPDLLCCHSMAIKTNILSGLIKYCLPMITNSDEMFRDYYIHNKIKVCVPPTVYFVQNRNDLGSLNNSVHDPEFFKTCQF